jgi:hypothetical protein
VPLDALAANPFRVNHLALGRRFVPVGTAVVGRQEARALAVGLAASSDAAQDRSNFFSRHAVGPLSKASTLVRRAIDACLFSGGNGWMTSPSMTSRQA